MDRASLMASAKAGNANAIAALMNQSLQPKGITARAQRHDHRLIIWLEAPECPHCEAMADYIQRGMTRLAIPVLHTVQVQGWRKGALAPDWITDISLQPEPTSHPPVTEEVPLTDPPPNTAELPPEPQATMPIAAKDYPPAVIQAYEQFNLPPGIPLPQIEAIYFKRKPQLVRQGHREAAEALKIAYLVLKAHLQAETASTSPADQSNTPTALEQLTTLFQQQGLTPQIKLHEAKLVVYLPAARVSNPSRAVALIYTSLEKQNLTALGLADVQEVIVYGLNSAQKAVWKRIAPMPCQGVSKDDTDLFSFNNRISNTFIFPGLMLLAILMNASPIVSSLLWGIKVWIHEFGHATIAWLGGRRAIPLPLGLTSYNPNRSIVVYLGILILLGLLFWVGRREQQRWPMILAGVLAVIQFGMTWLVPIETFEMLVYFGGIGGEFYLSTLLMVSFYFPMPQYWRWDFYRYPVVFAAAFTFWGQFWLWKQIRWGQASIPFGALWGEAEGGDMNQLINVYAWTPGQVIDTYNTIGNVCLWVLLGVYSYFFFKQNYPYLFGMVQRWIVRF